MSVAAVIEQWDDTTNEWRLLANIGPDYADGELFEHEPGKPRLRVRWLGAPAPIPMVLYCPACGTQHIDQPDPPRWTNPPHRTHLCGICAMTWRPSDTATTGVAALRTRGEADKWTAQPYTNANGALESTYSLRVHPEPQFWRHVDSGDLYRKIGAALEESSLRPMVVYASWPGGTVWVRPAVEFLGGQYIVERRTLGEPATFNDVFGAPSPRRRRSDRG